MVTQILFTAFVGLIALQRVHELRRSRKNEWMMRAAGGSEHSPAHFKVMTLIHSTWFLAMLCEVWLLERTLHPLLWLLPAALFTLGQWLRASAMDELGWRWSVRIFTVPGEPPVTTGIYRYLRHPNYLGVVLELGALPLVHGAWLTAIVFSSLNAVLLYVRVRAEERALRSTSVYERAFQDRPRFVPRLSDARSSP